MKKQLKKYLITDPLYYSNQPNKFENTLKSILDKHDVDIACFRDKHADNFLELATLFVKICKEYKIDNIIINGDYKLAKKLGATGVHLTSLQFDEIRKAKELNLFTIISCHDLAQIEKAKKSYVDAITYSPIFETPNKGKPKGLDSLKEALDLYKDLDIIALGGITNYSEVEKISQTNAYGFASIRYFI